MLRKALLGALFIAFLQGCAPTASVIGQEGMGWDQRTTSSIVKDDQIAGAGNNMIQLHPALCDNNTLDLHVYNQTLLIVGAVDNMEERAQLSALMKSIPGLRRIYNQVTLTKPLSYLQRLEDSWLTTKIKTRLMSEKQLHFNRIKVVSNDQNVYLLGLVNPKEAECAIAATKEVPGVKKIIRLFEII